MTALPSRDPIRSWEASFILIVTAVAAALRLYRLADWPLYSDELATIAHIRNWDSHIWLSPLAYLPVAAMLKMFGQGTWALRLWSVAVGISSVPLFYVCARRLGGRTLAAWAAGLLAVAPWHIAHSQVARHYPLQLLVGFAMVYWAYNAFERGSPSRYLLSVGAGLLMVLTRPTSVYLMCAILAYGMLLWLWPAVRPAGAWRGRQVGLFMAAQVVLIGIGYSLTGVYSIPEVYGRSPMHVVFTAGYYLTLPAVLVAAAAGAVGFWQRNRMVMLLALYAFLPIALVSFTALVRTAAGVATFLVLPGLLLLVAWSAAVTFENLDRSTRWLAVAMGLAVVGAFLMRDVAYYTYARGYRPAGHEAVSYVMDRMEPDDALLTNCSMDLTSRHPRTGADVTFIRNTGEARPPEPNRRTWFISEDVYSTWNIPVPGRKWLSENARLMTVFPSYIGPRSRSLWVYLYTPPEQTAHAGSSE